ncbi:uncharacterized protein RSE6_06326 [Rhynchosporium secalis]|uniref:Uncharacterized protein n=1 Tax=Rhynchosporium secalis TaxID=38038 RepID=A0A1E1MA65_RHYSE|nr:uncharacterized protein RSE6_06326 [Rhynchosporium secalis]
MNDHTRIVHNNQKTLPISTLIIACHNYQNNLSTRGYIFAAGNGVTFSTAVNAKLDGLSYSPGQKKPVISYWYARIIYDQAY